MGILIMILVLLFAGYVLLSPIIIYTKIVNGRRNAELNEEQREANRIFWPGDEVIYNYDIWEVVRDNEDYTCTLEIQRAGKRLKVPYHTVDFIEDDKGNVLHKGRDKGRS